MVSGCCLSCDYASGLLHRYVSRDIVAETHLNCEGIKASLSVRAFSLPTTLLNGFGIMQNRNRRSSSVGQSNGFVNRGSRVRISPSA